MPKSADAGGSCDDKPVALSPMGDKKVVLHKPKSSVITSQNKKNTRRLMKQTKCTKKKGGWKHFNFYDRVRLESMIRINHKEKEKLNFTKLSKELGRHRTTIMREYKRGLVININSQLEKFETYSAHKANDEAENVSLNKGPIGRLTNKMGVLLRDLIINEDLSPYAATDKLRKSGEYQWVPSERTVYYAIDAGLIGVTRNDLPYKPPVKTRKKRSIRMAYTNTRGKSITERPPEAEERIEYGHWEMDTVVGGKGKSPPCLLVLTERMSRQEIIRKIPTKSQEAVIKALNRLERFSNASSLTIKTLTCDNGCEFLNGAAIEQSVLHAGLRYQVFFAHPYRASERGSNENANRIIRRFIPKGEDIAKYTNKQIQKIEDWINNLPRKILDGLSASEKVELYFKENIA